MKVKNFKNQYLFKMNKNISLLKFQIIHKFKNKNISLLKFQILRIIKNKYFNNKIIKIFKIIKKIINMLNKIYFKAKIKYIDQIQMKIKK